jgi:uncharacterized protein (TIGR02265 family)
MVDLRARADTPIEPREAPFVDPRIEASVDLAAHLACLPPNATCKGMFFRSLLDLGAARGSESDLARSAGIELRRYVPFLDYPMRDNLLLTVEVARRVFGHLKLGEALVELGRTSFATFLSSHVGRVAVLAAGDSVGDVLALAPRAYPLVLSFGKVRVVTREPGRVVVECASMPAFLETYQVGTVYGIFDRFGVKGRVRIALTDIANAVIEATW